MTHLTLTRGASHGGNASNRITLAQAPWGLDLGNGERPESAPYPRITLCNRKHKTAADSRYRTIKAALEEMRDEMGF